MQIVQQFPTDGKQPLEGDDADDSGGSLLGTHAGILLSRVTRRPVRWLWFGRLAFGKLSLLDGKEGSGKSFITADLIARCTTGRPMPGEPDTVTRAPFNVILVAPEDDPADTLAPRLDAAQADTRRVRVFNLVNAGTPDERPFMLPDDISRLRAVVQTDQARFILLDPVMSCLSSRVKTHEDHSVRLALDGLRKLAQDLDVVVLLVRHLNKSSQQSASYRGMGSVAFGALCRTAFVTAEHPDDPTLRALAAVKSNIGPLAPTIAYRIPTTPTANGGQPVIEWHLEPLVYDADALLAASQNAQRREIVAALGKYHPTPLTPQELAVELGLDPGADYSRLRHATRRLLKEGVIVSPEPGKYGLQLQDASQASQASHASHVTEAGGDALRPVAAGEAASQQLLPASVTPVMPVTREEGSSPQTDSTVIQDIRMGEDLRQLSADTFAASTSEHVTEAGGDGQDVANGREPSGDKPSTTLVQACRDHTPGGDLLAAAQALGCDVNIVAHDA
jgi:hypothetical protein